MFYSVQFFLPQNIISTRYSLRIIALPRTLYFTSSFRVIFKIPINIVGALGLSVFVSMIRSYGNDYLQPLKAYLCLMIFGVGTKITSTFLCELLMPVEISVAANVLSDLLCINTAHVLLYLQLLCHLQWRLFG
jgi:hypothetical protein